MIPLRRLLRASPWPWLLGLACVAALTVVGVRVWSRSAEGASALLQLGAEGLYAEVQQRLEEALGAVLPDLPLALQADDAHRWPLPGAGHEAAVRCLLVAHDGQQSWWEVQRSLEAAVAAVGGTVLWAERLPGTTRPRDLREASEDRDLLRIDLGVYGRPTHTLVLHRASTRRPDVRWGQDARTGAWRQLQARAGDPVVALVIDDWGHRQDATTGGLLALDAPLTLCVLPGLSYSRRFALEGTDLALPQTAGPGDRASIEDASAARLAAGCPVTFGLGPGPERLTARRREVFLHLPMQPQGYPDLDPGPRAVLMGMPRRDIGALLDDCLRMLPGVRGVNNHMGSAATAHEQTMQDLMAELRQRDLVFLDSLTSSASVAYRTARAAGLPAARNRIFLDHDHQDPQAIRSRLQTLVRSARGSGFAVGIGHPHPATLQVLAEEVPRLQAEGVLFVTVSELLALQAAVADAGA